MVIRLLCLLVLLLSFGCAEDYQPQHWITAGAGFNHLAERQASGWMNFAAKVADKTYSFSTVEITGQTSSVRTGVARILMQQGHFTLLTLADAGMVAGTATQNLGGAYSGGGTLAYDISRWTKLQNSYAIGTVRVLKTALGEVQPVFSFGFGKAF